MENSSYRQSLFETVYSQLLGKLL